MYVCMYVFVVCVYVFKYVLGDGVVPLQSADLDGATQNMMQGHKYFYVCMYVNIYSMCVCICVYAGRWCGSALECSRVLSLMVLSR